MNSCLKTIAKIKNTMVHSFTDGRLILSSRDEFYEVRNLKNPKLNLLGRIPWNSFQKALKIRSLDRILRNDIRIVHLTRKGDFLICNRKGWWYFKILGNNLIRLSRLLNTLPLARGLCELENGSIFIGGYSRNKRRNEVTIYRLDQDLNSEVCYVFEKNTIRHIHGVIKDKKVQNRIWILTGDNDEESHFYYTDDEFKSLNLFLSAGQISRAADLVFKGDKIIWGTDSPVKPNFLVEASITSPEKYGIIAPLPGPVYYSCQNTAGSIYFATTAEPGPAAEKKISRIFSVSGDNKIKEVYNCNKDIFPQHGIIYFPSGILPGCYVIYSKKALKPNEGYTIIAEENFC